VPVFLSFDFPMLGTFSLSVCQLCDNVFPTLFRFSTRPLSFSPEPLRLVRRCRRRKTVSPQFFSPLSRYSSQRPSVSLRQAEFPFSFFDLP